MNCADCGDSNWDFECVTCRDRAAEVSNSRLIGGLCGLFEKYNDGLCFAISALAKHHVTGNRLTGKEYKDIQETLEGIRVDLHKNKAT